MNTWCCDVIINLSFQTVTGVMFALSNFLGFKWWEAFSPAWIDDWSEIDIDMVSIQANGCLVTGNPFLKGQRVKRLVVL